MQVSGVVSTGCPANIARMYTAALPGSFTQMKCSWGKESVELYGHHHAFPPVEGGLEARKALQRSFKVAAGDPDAFEVWARIERRDIDPYKRGNLIIGDGRIHIS
jgi:hypothetical protein